MGESERITVEDALRAITIEAARSLQLEDEIGSLEVGKRADFTVLEQDPFTVPVDDLHQVEVGGTVLAGEILLRDKGRKD